MAAIITTVNAQFLLISSNLTKDIILNIKILKDKISEKKKSLISIHCKYN